MAVTPPTRGQQDWDDEMNNALQSLDAAAQSAAANASTAVSTANSARDIAQSVHTAVIGTADAATAGFINTPDSETATALSATYGVVENVRKYGATGDGVTDDSPAIQAACDAISSTRGGTVYFPPGNYRARNIRPKSRTRLTGDGATLTYHPTGAGTYDCLVAFGDLTTVGGPTEASNLRDIHIDGLNFRGNGDTLGFSEHQHLLHLSGVSDVIVSNCTFVGMQGDGIIIEATYASGIERHNERITIAGCKFDGLNHYGRNGISIIEGRDITIEGCDFYRTTRADMPGAVDIEPNGPNTWTILRNITVRGCSFRDTWGTGDVAMILNPTTFTTAPSGFLFDGNYHVGGKIAYQLTWTGHDATTADSPISATISRVHAEAPRADAAFIQVSHLRGVTLTGSRIDGFQRGLGTLEDVIDVTITDNDVRNSAETTQVVLDCYGDWSNLTVSRNTIVRPAAAGLAAVVITGAGASSGLKMHGNVLSGVSALFSTYGGHTTTASGNYASGNVGASVDLALIAGAPNVAGSRGGNAALAQLLTALASAGVILDNSTV